MKKLFILPIILVSTFLLVTSSCKKDPVNNNGGTTTTQKVPVVSQFVYDGMSLYYLWNKEMQSIKPTVTSTDPKTYFKSVLYSTDTQHGWSWITDDVQGLLADFSGEPKDFGYSLMVLWFDKEHTKIIGIVKYVFPNSPAASAGIKRGNIITKINGADINLNNYQSLFGANAITITYTDNYLNNPKDASLTPTVIKTDPVLYSNVIETAGKKIGYLFYTGFISNYNNSLYNAFNSFKQAGVTDLVLDLRYNHGGAISAANYLCSMIAPRNAVESKSVFATMSYNSDLNAYFDAKSWSRNDSLGSYDKKTEQNPLNANLNLNTVYIIATGDSYSASELTTFCLRPIMNVVHIGENTGGKYTASWTIHAYDETVGVPIYDKAKMSSTDITTLKNWAMQPIVAKYTDKNGKDFSSPGYLAPDYPITSIENEPSKWTPIGDPSDYLLAKAISVITGKSYYVPTVKSARVTNYQDAKLFSPKDNLIKESVNIDNIKNSPFKLNQLKKFREFKSLPLNN